MTFFTELWNIVFCYEETQTNRAFSLLSFLFILVLSPSLSSVTGDLLSTAGEPPCPRSVLARLLVSGPPMTPMLPESRWSKPNPGIFPKKLHPAWFFRNLEGKIGHEIFVKTEKTEYLSNQLTYAHFDRKFIFPIKFGTSEQIFIFWISKMFQISGSPTVKKTQLFSLSDGGLHCKFIHQTFN